MSIENHGAGLLPLLGNDDTETGEAGPRAASTSEDSAAQADPTDGQCPSEGWASHSLSRTQLPTSWGPSTFFCGQWRLGLARWSHGGRTSLQGSGASLPQRRGTGGRKGPSPRTVVGRGLQHQEGKWLPSTLAGTTPLLKQLA